MTHELAKKLKDAGYEFKMREESGVKIDGLWFLSPSLSELIKACGDRFWGLQRGHQMRDEEHRWSARGGNENEPKTCFGSDPEEAVANLWLALQK